MAEADRRVLIAACSCWAKLIIGGSTVAARIAATAADCEVPAWILTGRVSMDSSGESNTCLDFGFWWLDEGWRLLTLDSLLASAPVRSWTVLSCSFSTTTSHCVSITRFFWIRWGLPISGFAAGLLVSGDVSSSSASLTWSLYGIGSGLAWFRGLFLIFTVGNLGCSFYIMPKQKCENCLK